MGFVTLGSEGVSAVEDDGGGGMVEDGGIMSGGS